MIGHGDKVAVIGDGKLGLLVAQVISWANYDKSTVVSAICMQSSFKTSPVIAFDVSFCSCKYGNRLNGTY